MGVNLPAIRVGSVMRVLAWLFVGIVSGMVLSHLYHRHIARLYF
jgi:hypothetical protein